MSKKIQNKTQMKNIEVRPYTEAEEDALYGTKTKVTGAAYKRNDGFYDHMYLQREHDVLHVNVKGQVLNTLNVGFLNQESGMEQITLKEFTEAVKQFIYEAQVDKFWN